MRERRAQLAIPALYAQSSVVLRPPLLLQLAMNTGPGSVLSAKTTPTVPS